MAVISLASLKGGVGKTSVSLNLAAAFSKLGYRTLLIDLDPTSHSSRFFIKDENIVSPFAKLLLANQDILENKEQIESLVELAIEQEVSLLRKVRDNLWLIPSSNDLRHFYWGRSARIFRNYFPTLVSELYSDYDYVVVDTPPDFNILTRNAIALSNLVIIPVDASLMSIHCLEDLIDQAGHIEKPAWSIVKTMVNRQAKKIGKLSEQRLGDNSLIQEDLITASSESKVEGSEDTSEEDPIYLFNSKIFRSEVQNKLSFQGKTVFESKENKFLAPCYLNLAKEVEQLITHIESPNEHEFSAELFGSSSALC